MPDVALIVDGRRYGGWKEIRVTRGIEAVAGSFALSVSERFGGQLAPWAIEEGSECAVEIDGQRLITGFVDARGHAYDAQSHSASVAGRDRTADLVDCSAVLANWEWGGTPAPDLVRILAAPFGVKVTIQPGLVFPRPPIKFTVNPGDTAFEVIERACRMAGVLPVADGAGGLLLTRAGSARATTALVEGQNILEASADYDATRRFRRYVVAAQHPGTDAWFGEGVAGVQAEAIDENVRAGRVLMIRSEGLATPEYAQARASWEATVRAARAGRVAVAVQGWTQADGALWPVNALCRVISSMLALDADLLIAEVSYTLTASGGTRTALSLYRPDAFKPQPVIPEVSDPWKLTVDD